MQLPTDEALSWKRWFTTLVWYVYKKQGHDQWRFKASQSSRGMKAVV